MDDWRNKITPDLADAIVKDINKGVGIAWSGLCDEIIRNPDPDVAPIMKKFGEYMTITDSIPISPDQVMMYASPLPKPKTISWHKTHRRRRRTGSTR